MKHSDPAGTALRQLDGLREALGAVSADASAHLVELILQARRVFITGQGRSGRVSMCFATRLAQMGMDVNVPGYANCRKIESQDLLIAVSCSGRTITTVELAAISRRAGAPVAAITAVAGSPLSEKATHLVLIPSNAPNVRAKSSCVNGPLNNTLFEQSVLLYLDALVGVLLAAKGKSDSVLGQEHTNLE